MGTYPRPHFCQPSTTPNTPLGKSKSVTWRNWEISSQNFQAFLLQQGRRRFSVPRLVGLHLPKKRKKKENPSAVECLWDTTKRNRWLTCEYPFCSLGPTFQLASRKFSMHCLADHFQRDNVEPLTMALFQILVSCLARKRSELFSADAKSDPERPRTMTPKYGV